jgi:hypothetical protein
MALDRQRYQQISFRHERREATRCFLFPLAPGAGKPIELTLDEYVSLGGLISRNRRLNALASTTAV